MVSTKNKTKSVNPQRANSIPSKQVVLLEAENTDLLRQETIRSEVNLLNYPFFALRDKDVHERTETKYKDVVKRDGQPVEISWNVSANSKYGYPATFDRKVHKAIEHIISGMKKPIQNPVRIGSLLNLAKLMGLGLSKKGKPSGKAYKLIHDSLRRIVATTIDSEGTFYYKGKEKWIRDVFHLYDRVVFIGQKLPNGEIADTNYVVLGSWYLDSINSLYTKPLDYTYYRSLQTPIASRLYELLGVKFKGSLFINYRYSKLCQLLPLKKQNYFSDAKKILKPAHDELIRTGFFEKVEWQTITGNPHDWYVCYWGGERAKKEIELAERQGALPPPDDLEPAQSTATSTPQQSDEDNAIDDVVVSLRNFGISKKIAERLAKEHAHEYILEKLELVQWFRDTKSPLVAKNPAGFARRAIEEDYPAPPQYKSKKQQALEAEEKQQEEQRRLSCALCEGTGYYKVAEDRMAACLHGAN